MKKISKRSYLTLGTALIVFPGYQVVDSHCPVHPFSTGFGSKNARFQYQLASSLIVMEIA